MTNTKVRPPVSTRYIPWPSELAQDMIIDRYSPRSARPSRTVYSRPDMPTPLLALDVDGPLSPFAGSAKNLRRRGFRAVEWRSRVTYLPGSSWAPYNDLWLNPRMGEMLSEFSRVHDVELVWASMWQQNCNTIIAPVLGLPRLDWVDFQSNPLHSYWKWPSMALAGAGRPLAWLDDGFASPRKQALARTAGFRELRRGLPTLLHQVDPAVGITTSDLDAVAGWLKGARLAW